MYRRERDHVDQAAAAATQPPSGVWFADRARIERREGWSLVAFWLLLMIGVLILVGRPAPPASADRALHSGGACEALQSKRLDALEYELRSRACQADRTRGLA